MEPKSDECKECGARKGFLQTQMRRLREKLEYAELQVHELAFECSQLREALKTAKLQGVSSLVPRRESIQLPNELLREIFSLATSMGGLAFSPWNVETRGRSWNISSRTRRSIPLVSKQWNAVGAEFVYEHIVLSLPFQISHLVHLLNSRDRKMRHQHVHWIRGIELTPGRVTRNAAREFWDLVPSLVNLLPPSRLRLFGMDALEHNDKMAASSASKAMAMFVSQFKETLEVLHLPFAAYSLDWDYFASTTIQPRDAESPYPGAFPRLRTLSTSDGRWTVPGPRQRNENHDPLFRIRGHAPALRALSFAWPEGSINNTMMFLSAPHDLEKVYIEERVRSLFLAHHFDFFLGLVPRLRHLTVAVYDVQGVISVSPNHVSHASLEEIVLMMGDAKSYKAIGALWSIFEKVKTGKLPGLRKIILYGQFYGGCLDSGIILGSNHINLWQQAIDVCAEEGVELANTQGDPLYLWNARHRIKFYRPEQKSNLSEEGDADAESAGSEEASSEEDESSECDESCWSTEEGSGGRDYPSDDGEVISNDSEDSPYRYAYEPDLEYETDSGVSSG